MSDYSLASAYATLRDRIAALAAAPAITAEELAFLGTALERIGGRASVLEVEDGAAR